MYCAKKLTETSTEEDIPIWETKGIETGIIVNDSDFTYNTDQYNSIPVGNWYTTIFHFADGSTYMTEIKQK